MTPEEMKVREILKRIRAIDFRSKAQIEGGLSGAYRSIFKGQGLNFEELRAYVPGDDIRLIDWKTTAKLGDPFIKVFSEERELTLLLVMDVSASTICGSIQQSKREFATLVGSTLAHSALKNSDQVGLMLFSDQIEKFFEPKKGQQHLLPIIRESLFFKPQHNTTDLNACLKALHQMLKKRTIICIISDFLPNQADTDRELFRSIARLRRKHNVLCIRITDPRETDLPNVGIIALEDAETQGHVYVNTASKSVRKRFAEAQKRYWNAFFDACNHNGIRVLTLTNGSEYTKELNTFMKRH
jgi:uncharacterized protein (DUF58 family)